MELRTFGVERLGALSDGVVAIGATLLVIDLKITPEEGEVFLSWARLLAHGPEILSWAISFVMIGVIWYEQHYALAHMARTDAPVIAGTLAQLALISLIPFASSLIGFFEHSPPAGVLFSGVMAANGLMLALNSWVIGRRRHLHGRPEAAELTILGRYQVIAYPATAALAICLTYVHHPLMGVAAWIVSPILLSIYHARRRAVASARAELTPSG